LHQHGLDPTFFKMFSPIFSIKMLINIFRKYFNIFLKKISTFYSQLPTQTRLKASWQWREGPTTARDGRWREASAGPTVRRHGGRRTDHGRRGGGARCVLTAIKWLLSRCLLDPPPAVLHPPVSVDLILRARALVRAPRRPIFPPHPCGGDRGPPLLRRRLLRAVVDIGERTCHAR
jgi:hypothetical protein